MRSSEWKSLLKNYGVSVFHVWNLSKSPKEIFVTNCSRSKANISKGTPAQLYQSPSLKKILKIPNLEHYAILSDFYGIVFSDQVIETYDMPPSELTDRDLWDRGEGIRSALKSRSLQDAKIVYTCQSPARTVPYLMMLLASEVPFALALSFQSYGLGLVTPSTVSTDKSKQLL